MLSKNAYHRAGTAALVVNQFLAAACRGNKLIFTASSSAPVEDRSTKCSALPVERTPKGERT